MSQRKGHEWSAAVREILARAIHEEYMRHGTRDGHSLTDNPSMLPWDKLPEHMKESNRLQADHIPTKLAEIGCTIGPLGDHDPEPIEFLPDELEPMARLEHMRWAEERRGNGWRLGPKDLTRKQTPYLVPYDQLSEEMKEYDRNVVRALPFILASAGLGVRRLKSKR